MELSAEMVSAQPGVQVQNDARTIGGAHDAQPGGGIVGQRWPTLGRAIGRYEQQVAEEFSRQAYERVEGGIIRLEGRRELAAAAEELGIRAFDAQLLIACAIRKWALDHAYDAVPSRHAPALSFEYKAWGRLWVRLALVACTAAILDGIIIWKWLW